MIKDLIAEINQRGEEIDRISNFLLRMKQSRDREIYHPEIEKELDKIVAEELEKVELLIEKQKFSLRRLENEVEV